MDTNYIQYNQPSPRKRNHIKIILLILAVLLIAISVVLFILMKEEALPEPRRMLNNGKALSDSWDGMTGDEIQAMLRESQRSAIFEYSEENTLEDGMLHVDIRNEESNTTVWQVRMVLDETNEVLGVSVPIYPGERIKTIPVDTVLNTGAHDATIIIEVYDLETENFIKDCPFNGVVVVK